MKEPRTLNGPPFVLRPENQAEDVDPATRMLASDLALQQKFAALPGTPASWQPKCTPPMICALEDPTGTEVSETASFGAQSPANLLLPPPPDPQPEEKSSDSKYSLSGPSLGTKDGGIGIEERRDVREYIQSGYTRTNPYGTTKVDTNFGGKWKDDFTIIQGDAKTDLFDVSVAEGSFGDGNDAFTGQGKVLSADAGASAGFKVDSGGVSAHAGAKAQGSMAQGSVASTDDHAISGAASGSAVSGSAEAKGEVVLTPEQATLGGKLGAEVNLIEGKFSGNLTITPKRVADPMIHLWNWAVDDDVEPLSENWDIGISIGGEVSGQVGAQAGAEARAGYEKGKLRAEAGAKVGLGVGAGVKVSGGVQGADKIWNGIKSAWNWAWGD
ncbi:hypothetical protein [Roseibium sediminis]|uniref:hypothetical protein n=1 Tax=Roseibium sediminis TaxID=1775174 RepID=UPI00123E2516|nr:hypothetical protein [Roseibium sediminis]